MAELLSTAPFYQNVRKHSTNVGEILCTGKGCVACNPDKNGDEDMIKILGDIDTVHFEMESNNGLKLRERPDTAPGCYGDNINGKHGANKKIRKKIKLKKKTAKKLISSEGKTTPKILVTDIPQNYENKMNKKEKIESPKLKENLVRNVQNGNVVANDSRKYLAVPSRSKLSQIKRTTAKKTKTLYTTKKESGKSSQIIKTVNTDKDFSRERYLYHTFPGVRVTRSSGKCEKNSKDMSFLDMLKTGGEVGIYDPKLMKLNNSSIWIEKILKQGVKEEELLPRIPQALKERKSGDGSELETTDKNTQTSLASNAYKAKPMLPRLSFNGKVEVRGGESVLIIEHEHDTKKDNKDGVLHRIGFALEEHQLKGSRNFPKCSIIQIADSLGEFVEMGRIKVIQRRNKRWLILVEGKITKDFLLQNGVVLGGRHFELIELKTF